MPTVIQNVLVGSKAESQMLRGIASEKSSPNVLHVWLAGGVTPWTNVDQLGCTIQGFGLCDPMLSSDTRKSKMKPKRNIYTCTIDEELGNHFASKREQTLLRPSSVRWKPTGACEKLYSVCDDNYREPHSFSNVGAHGFGN